ncbi:hypothetical protein D9619_005392 [Psilocybe cf. subviscida]|uniref:Uncharacterized protein n=1 Tax=Psilocybe cf. subviscida TaxID=2480587 RepID=A0A8H5BXQ3_9AGAR|nr:hypothetical protein D9619_005392 [Psilocybe cf. subviscida]
MWVPFITKRSNSKLERRKGGGGGGKGGGSGGGKSSGSGSGAGSSSSKGSSGAGGAGGSGRASTPISTGGGGSKSATPFSNGGGPISTIPSGSLFAGRSVGGGTRNEVYGSSTYGSGYPNGAIGRGVAGRPFPFFFWPLAWGGAAVGSAAYLHNTEYGRFDNSSRPGGIMVTAAFSSSTQNTTYRLVADNATVTDLIGDLMSNCTSSHLNNSTTILATNFNDSLPAPKPEQVVQYYRASSVALTLDGYNNTGALGPEGTPDTPLPTNIDTTLLDCLNTTIGNAVPLVDAGGSIILATPSTMGLVSLVYLVWSLSSWA